jgi:hypothetical protein
MRCAVIRAALITAILIASTSAHADDDKFDSLTLLPWSDAAFVLNDSNHRAVVQYSQLAHGLGIHASVSAPLDDDTRIATFSTNKQLTSGFKASLEIGPDTRAAHLAALESATRVVAEAVARFSVVSSFVSAQLTYQHDLHLTVVTADSVFIAACTKYAVAPDADVSKTCSRANIDTVAPKLCDAFTTSAGLDADPAHTSSKPSCGSTKDFIDLATAYWGRHCLAQPVPANQHEACAIAGPVRDSIELQPLAEQFAAILRSQDLVDDIWRIYTYLAPDAAKECKTRSSKCIEDNAKVVADTIGDFIKTAPLARRDLMMFAIQDRSDYALLLSASTSYDNASVYHSLVGADGVASSPVTESTYDIQIGLDATWYTPRRGLSANLRVGVERSRAIGATPFQHCEVTDGSTAASSGTSCDPNALFRSKPQAGASSSFQARAAVDYQFSTTLQEDTVIPGIEGRLGLDNVGDGAVVSARASLFAMPVKGTTAARIGVALDVQHPLDADAGSPHWIVSPLVFIAATFSDLMTN